MDVNSSQQAPSTTRNLQLDIQENNDQLALAGVLPGEDCRAVTDLQPGWDKRLGECSKEIERRTLQSTTQLCAKPMEMENRIYPRQHRKSRIPSLDNGKRIPSRTDSDTFYASLKSIRGYKCVQIFFCHMAHYIFVKCMRRESHSHGAYQDFVRNVGIPNTLLTDNAQTQVGKKWTETSRKNRTKSITSAPHNQNQNQSERKIQDLKHKTDTLLRLVDAPLVFWCYALEFIVDCYQHSACPQLDWRTPMEKMWGCTPDISMFRFRFWQPIWYYEPTAKFPKPNLLPGRFMGIA